MHTKSAIVVERLEDRALFSVGVYEGLPTAMKSDAGFSSLFNGTSLTGFYTYIAGKGVNNDPQHYFKAENGMLHIMGIPNTGQTTSNGYLATTKTYSNYRLRFEYKWGTNRFAPAASLPRDSGVLIDMQGADRIWPQSLEVNIKENLTGEMWMLPNAPVTSISGNTQVVSTTSTPKVYKAGGAAYHATTGRIARNGLMADRLTDWNTVDVIVEGSSAIVMLNGTVVNRITGMKTPSGATLSSGKIAFQASSAEVWYRNIKIKPTVSAAPPTGAIHLFDSSSSTAQWIKRNGGGAIAWPGAAGELTVAPGTGDIKTKTTFKNFKLHVEFNVPVKADSATEQDRGNSGIGLGGSYEVQILDSYQRTLSGKNDLGAIYGIKDASLNAALPAGAWERYDITFTAAKWSGTTKIADAHATVYLNGFLIQNNVDIPTSTFTFDPENPAGGPIILQDHANQVRFRNIWIVQQ
jgi:hypothetical protein